jgi:hypothetical protein
MPEAEIVADVEPLTRMQIVEKELIEELKGNENADSKQSKAAPKEQEIVDEGETETEVSASEDEVEQEDEPNKSSKGVQKRFNKLTKKNSELQRQLDQERSEKERLISERQPQTPTKPPQDTSGEPDPNNFETYAEYNRALVRHEAKVIREEEKRQEAEQRIQSELVEAGKKFEKNLESAKSKYDDFDDVFDPDLQVNGAMQAVMLDSDVGADIAYYLCKNPDEAAEIASMNPSQASRRMGLIEARFLNSEDTPGQPKKVSKAPTPVNGLKGSTSKTNGVPEDIDQFKAWYKKTYNRR